MAGCHSERTPFLFYANKGLAHILCSELSDDVGFKLLCTCRELWVDADLRSALRTRATRRPSIVDIATHCRCVDSFRWLMELHRPRDYPSVCEDVLRLAIRKRNYRFANALFEGGQGQGQGPHAHAHTACCTLRRPDGKDGLLFAQVCEDAAAGWDGAGACALHLARQRSDVCGGRFLYLLFDRRLKGAGEVEGEAGSWAATAFMFSLRWSPLAVTNTVYSACQAGLRDVFLHWWQHARGRVLLAMRDRSWRAARAAPQHAAHFLLYPYDDREEEEVRAAQQQAVVQCVLQSGQVHRAGQGGAKQAWRAGQAACARRQRQPSATRRAHWRAGPRHRPVVGLQRGR